ncbi:hypothetical protein KSZ_65650 [Dictyobacter formicarum]|uniref:Transposase IS701-like DDE domain-containing protein n=2 Tax=Dictyobacter formicarum TaxID=2778368 RepID=A0ABQ3VQL3_9CHLR|nr:hypothetical protein KSZ_65650 [Dictyobacter formicarum]
MGETAPYAIQHVLDRAKWDCDGVRDELHAYAREALSSPDAVLVIDETGFLKKRHAPRGAPFRMKKDSMAYTVKERS